MASILRPFSNILNPGPLRIPGGNLTIDWSHSLTNGLIGCYLPGVMRGTDITGMGPNLTPLSAATISSMEEGPGLQSVAANSGMTATATPAFKSWTQFSIYWRAYVIGAPIATTDFAGVSYAIPEASPYVVASIGVASNPLTVRALWNTGGVFTEVSPGPIITTSVINSFGCSFTVSASALCQMYSNGVASGSAFAFGASGPISSATSSVGINTYSPTPTRYSNSITTAAYFWNRALAADEWARLHREPYSFLIPAEYELPLAFLSPPPLRQRHFRFRTDTGAVDATPTWGAAEDTN
jgi:hypothetical protein